MKQLLFKLGLWLMHRYGPETDITLRVLDSRLVLAARVAVLTTQNAVAGATAENKHARAIAALMRAAPKASTRDIVLAVELAIRG